MATAQLAARSDSAAPRRRTFLHALAFVTGFSLVFVALGASLGVVGFALQDNLIWFQRVAGAALIVLGLHLTELITIPLLARTYQFGDDLPAVPPAQAAPPPARRNLFRRYGRSLFVGGAFSVGWTPCVGPILAGILTLAADSSSVAQGTLLLVFFALGLGLPFLLVGAALGSSTALLRKLGPWLSTISILSGVLIVFVGMLIVLDRVTVLNNSFNFLPGAADNAASSGGTVTGVFGFAVAFAGGFLSFLSPCVLPLVPIYLSHLAGVGAEEAAAAQRPGAVSEAVP